MSSSSEGSSSDDDSSSEVPLPEQKRPRPTPGPTFSEIVLNARVIPKKAIILIALLMQFNGGAPPRVQCVEYFAGCQSISRGPSGETNRNL